MRSTDKKRIISEQREGQTLNYPGDDTYEYMFQNEKWYTRRIGRNRWINITTRYPETVENLIGRFPEFASPVTDPSPSAPEAPEAPPAQTQTDIESVYPFDTFIDSKQAGDRFRAWVQDNKTPEEQAQVFARFSDKKLDPPSASSQHDNQHMRTAYSVWGFEFLRSVSSSFNPDPEPPPSSQQPEGYVEPEEDEDTGGGFFSRWWNDDEDEDTAAAAAIDSASDTASEIASDSGFRVHPEYVGDDGEPRKINPTEREQLERGEEVSTLHYCRTGQCAQYVSNTLQGMQPDMVRGSAWHRHRPQNLSYSAFSNIDPSAVAEIEDLFNDMNRRGPSSSFNSRAQRITRSFIPDQEQFMDLQIGDVVGLYHHNSTNAAKAFWEGATGHGDWGEGSNIRGSAFSGWSPEKIGERENFSLGPNSRKSGFGMNSHVGFVGAITSRGEPVIFHNIGIGGTVGVGSVTATPVGALSDRSDAIVWVDPAQSPVAAVNPGTMNVTDIDPAEVEQSALAEHLWRNIKKERLKKKNKNLIFEYPSTTFLNRDVEKSLREINPAGPELMRALDVDRQTFEKILAAAIVMIGRESDYGEGRAYKYHPTRSNLTQTTVAQINNWVRDWTGMNPANVTSYADPSVGPAQIRYGTVLQGLPEEYRHLIGVSSPADLSSMTKALLSATGLLAGYFNHAIRIGLSRNRPGVNRGHSWRSTGSAALDMAIAAYNGGPSKIANYCGTGYRKSKCNRGDPDHVRNYIPASARFEMGYVNEIASGLPAVLRGVRSIIGVPPPRPNRNLRLPANTQAARIEPSDNRDEPIRRGGGNPRIQDRDYEGI